jgi:hypothetical protein
MKNDQRLRQTQYILILSGLAFTILAVGFIARIPWTVSLLPLHFDTTYNDTLGFMFIASMVSAWGVSSIYIGATGKIAPAFTTLINYILVFGGLGILYLQLSLQNTNSVNQSALSVMGIFSILIALFSAYWLWLLRNTAVSNPIPMPKTLRRAIGVMTLFVGITSMSLIVFKYNILPWDGTTIFGIVYGWLFVGTGAALLYALVRNKWEIVAAQLLGFLAYDLVLIPPFIDFFSQVRPDKLPGLIMYFCFVVGSAILAIYYLFFDVRTRITLLSDPVSSSSIADVPSQTGALS